jgi:hypothetical protein
MKISDVQKKLSKKYDVQHFVNLNEIDQTKSFSILHDILSSVKQEKFSDNYRIVFYHTRPLLKTYPDCPCNILDHLQKILHYYDIPNFFVVVVSNDKSISSDLKSVHQKYTSVSEHSNILSIIIPNLTE